MVAVGGHGGVGSRWVYLLVFVLPYMVVLVVVAAMVVVAAISMAIVVMAILAVLVGVVVVRLMARGSDNHYESSSDPNP